MQKERARFHSVDLEETELTIFSLQKQKCRLRRKYVYQKYIKRNHLTK